MHPNLRPTLLCAAAGLLLLSACSNTNTTNTTSKTNASKNQASTRPAVELIASPEEYTQICGICHLPNGEGVPGAFPPLDQRLAAMAAKEAGRDYLVGLLQNGLYGTIEVNGVSYNGAMLPLASQLDDAGMAAMLNYVVTTFAGGTGNFTAAEITARKATIGTTKGSQLRKSAGL